LQHFQDELDPYWLNTAKFSYSTSACCKVSLLGDLKTQDPWRQKKLHCVSKNETALACL